VPGNRRRYGDPGRATAGKQRPPSSLEPAEVSPIFPWGTHPTRLSGDVCGATYSRTACLPRPEGQDALRTEDPSPRRSSKTAAQPAWREPPARPAVDQLAPGNVAPALAALEAGRRDLENATTHRDACRTFPPDPAFRPPLADPTTCLPAGNPGLHPTDHPLARERTTGPPARLGGWLCALCGHHTGAGRRGFLALRRAVAGSGGSPTARSSADATAGGLSLGGRGGGRSRATISFRSVPADAGLGPVAGAPGPELRRNALLLLAEVTLQLCRREPPLFPVRHANEIAGSHLAQRELVELLTADNFAEEGTGGGAYQAVSGAEWPR